jgi:hypothetical protein
MTNFTVKIEDGHATATHHPSGHVFEFSIAPTAPHVRGGTVRENQKADRGPDSLWGAAKDAVLMEARAAGLIPK